jgi:hypothetical protein
MATLVSTSLSLSIVLFYSQFNNNDVCVGIYWMLGIHQSEHLVSVSFSVLKKVMLPNYSRN